MGDSILPDDPLSEFPSENAAGPEGELGGEHAVVLGGVAGGTTHATRARWFAARAGGAGAWCRTLVSRLPGQWRACRRAVSRAGSRVGATRPRIWTHGGVVQNRRNHRPWLDGMSGAVVSAAAAAIVVTLVLALPRPAGDTAPSVETGSAAQPAITASAAAGLWPPTGAASDARSPSVTAPTDRRDSARPSAAGRAALPVASPRTPPASGRPFRGTLAIRSEPDGAEVFINGRREGTTPLVLRNLPVGSRAVRLTRDGYQVWSRAVQVVADRRTTVVADLRDATSP